MKDQKQLFLFDTDGIRAKANHPPMDTGTVMKLGKTLAEYVKMTTDPNPNRPPKILVGKDTRRSGYMLEQTITGGILSRGVDVLQIGPMPTPAISHLVRSFALDLGIMITASHNPYDDNGIKVFDRNGAKLSDKEERAVEKIFFERDFNGLDTIGRTKRINDASGRYIEYVKSLVDNVSLHGIKIVVDCANGSAYRTAPIVFSELGAEVIPLGVEPNGYNINDKCGSESPEQLQEVVKKEKADIGIALDGDADRTIFVDEKGTIIAGDYILALIAKNMKRKGDLRNDIVVATAYSNLALDEEMKHHGITVDKVINGDRQIAALCHQKGYTFGGEYNGHFIFSELADSGGGISAALMVLQVMKEEQKKLSSVAVTFDMYPQIQHKIMVKEKVPLKHLKNLQKTAKKWEDKFGKEGRVFLRYSGTQSMLRILIEAKDKELLNEASPELKAAAEEDFS